MIRGKFNSSFSYHIKFNEYSIFLSNYWHLSQPFKTNLKN